MKKKNDAILKLNTKPHSAYSIVAFILAILSILCSLSSVIMSGTIDVLTSFQIILIGMLEWIGFMMTIAGFGLAIIGEGAKDKEKIFSHISLLLLTLGLVYHGYIIWYGFF